MEEKIIDNFLNKKCIFRGDHSGVFFGELISKEGREVQIKNCRRIWYWDGANSISDLALIGTTKPNNCKFTKAVESIIVTDIIEIIPATDNAVESIERVPEWTQPR